MTNAQHPDFSRPAARPVGILHGTCFVLAVGFTVAMVLGVFA